MQKKLKLAVIAVCCAPSAFAQNTETEGQKMNAGNEAAFTLTEAQLGEDDNVSQNITIIGSNNNAYASEVGYRFSAARFKYRAFNAKYNEIYINGNPVNDMERGEFSYSLVGGLNDQTRNVETTLPFENNNFGFTAMGGSNNYNFRPSQLPVGQHISLAGANRNYTLRGMYSYNSGFNSKGWAFSGGLTYRWADRGYVKGTFYNSLSYFLGVEKLINDKHSLSLVTFGNPTERAAQAASTDEMYWLANSNYYNPNWGYQNGKVRSSRIVNSWAPTTLLTWDFKINEDMKLTTSLMNRYSMYSSSRLSYNNATNPAPDYYSGLPSAFYNVWNASDTYNRTNSALAAWQSAYDYLTASEANRQINWDRMYYANRIASAQGADAMYYLQAYHDNQLTFNLASTLNTKLTKNSTLDMGIIVSNNTGYHYQTLEDLLGADHLYNINTYVEGTYGRTSSQAQYDLNNPNAEVKVGDRFGYDYNILVNMANAWATYALNYKRMHFFASGRIGGVSMQRDGKMRNGLAADNSYGKSGTARFLEGGGKMGANFNLGAGNTINLGVGYEWKAPAAKTAFAAPQINNDFVNGLKVEKIFSSEIGYQLQTSWLHANLSAYYSRLENVTESSMAYSDIQNSFSYISLTGINKEYYGVELGLNFKVNSVFNIKALGTISEAKYINNANVRYMLSQDGVYHDDICINKNMREGGTPLNAGSIDLSYHNHGWFLDLIGNYYDKIYLYYSPIVRYYSDIPQNADGTRDLSSIQSQAKGNGGFMLDASIGRSIYLKKGSLSINLMLTNILNNIKICTGGMEQNRKSTDENGEQIRAYNFELSPKKFYANGTNGMLIVSYKF